MLVKPNYIVTGWLSLPVQFHRLGFFFFFSFFTVAALAQGGRTRVSGVVQDSAGAGLPNVTVTEKGVKNSTVTTSNGSYTINVANGNSLLQFSSIGYGVKEVVAADAFSVHLRTSSAALGEVVVIGYGTQRKVDLTSAVSSVKAENFVKAPVKDIGQLLQGKVAGLTVTTTNGDPRGASTILLRGTNSIIQGSAPLVLIDGVNGYLTDFNPEDVESIDILKDGSAAAIYGTRGNNGVILITTKRGRSTADSRPVIEYSTSFSTDKIAKRPDLQTADEFRKTTLATGAAVQDLGGSSDWVKAITKDNTFTQTHNLTLRAGNSRTNYVGSVGIRNLDGIFYGSENKTQFLNLSANHGMFDNRLRLTLGINTSLNKNPGTASNGSSQYGDAFTNNPTAPIDKPAGATYAGGYYMNPDAPNPVARINNSFGENKQQRTRLFGTLALQVTKEFSLSGTAAQTRSNQTRGYYETKLHPSTLLNMVNGYASRATTEYTDRDANLTAEFNKRVGKHNIKVLGGYSYFDSKFEDYGSYAYNFLTDAFTFNNMASATNLDNTGTLSYLGSNPFTYSTKNSYNLVAFFGRVNYSYDDRFLLSASVRREGSSKLIGANKPWGTFPAISGAYRINNESFMKGIKWLNDLKIRAGYGVTGNTPERYYGALEQITLSSNSQTFLNNGLWTQYYVPAQNENLNLKWEEKRETNIGLDFTLFNSRLSGTVDVYDRTTKDLLGFYPVPTPPNLLATSLANAGKINSKGIEVTLNYTAVKTKNIEWNTNVNFSSNRSKLVSLSNDQFKSTQPFLEATFLGTVINLSAQRTREGERIGNFYAAKVDGISSNGFWIYARPDGSKTDPRGTPPPDSIRQVVGNGLPKYFLNFNNTLRIQNFDLSVTMRGAFGFQILNQTRLFYENLQVANKNRLRSSTDVVFGVSQLKAQNNIYNGYYIEDGDYWKIDNIVLGYTVNVSKTKFIKYLRPYISTLNSATFTGYRGLDPEVNWAGIAPGVDAVYKYPTVRTFTVGLNVNF